MTAPLGGTRPAGDLTCGRLTEGGYCGRLSVRHVAWTPDMENGVMCAEHWAETQREWAFYDSHAVDAFCTMPGTEWLRSDEHPPGYCVMPVDQETASAVLEAQLVLPSADPTPMAAVST